MPDCVYCYHDVTEHGDGFCRELMGSRPCDCNADGLSPWQHEIKRKFMAIEEKLEALWEAIRELRGARNA